jgi:uncharacterized protein
MVLRRLGIKKSLSAGGGIWVEMTPRLLALLCVLLLSCGRSTKMKNPVGYFEIPVRDLDRATRFYTTVFGYQFERQTIDGNQMALFPQAEGMPGATGALAKGEVYVPTHNGAILYFSTDDVAQTLARANAAGGKTLYPRTAIGSNGFVAEFEDSEGNRIAIHSAAR